MNEVHEKGPFFFVGRWRMESLNLPASVNLANDL